MAKAYEYCGILFYIRKRVGIQHDEPYVEVSFGGKKYKYLINAAELIPHCKNQRVDLDMNRQVEKLLKIYKKDFLDFWNNEQKDNPDVPRPIIPPHKGKL